MLLASGAFFVGEFSLISASRPTKRSPRVENRGPAPLIRAGEHLSSCRGHPADHDLFDPARSGRRACRRTYPPASPRRRSRPRIAARSPFAVALGLVAVLHILLGEVVPKHRSRGRRRSAMLAPRFTGFIQIVRPLNGVLQLVGEHHASRVPYRTQGRTRLRRSPPSNSLMLGESARRPDRRRGTRASDPRHCDRFRCREVMIPLDRMRSVDGQVDPVTGGVGPPSGRSAGTSAMQFSRVPGARPRRLHRLPAPEGHARRHPRRQRRPGDDHRRRQGRPLQSASTPLSMTTHRLRHQLAPRCGGQRLWTHHRHRGARRPRGIRRHIRDEDASGCDDAVRSTKQHRLSRAAVLLPSHLATARRARVRASRSSSGHTCGRGRGGRAHPSSTSCSTTPARHLPRWHPGTASCWRRRAAQAAAGLRVLDQLSTLPRATPAATEA